jgi:hypothetical protein
MLQDRLPRKLHQSVDISNLVRICLLWDSNSASYSHHLFEALGARIRKCPTQLLGNGCDRLECMLLVPSIIQVLTSARSFDWFGTAYECIRIAHGNIYMGLRDALTCLFIDRHLIDPLCNIYIAFAFAELFKNNRIQFSLWNYIC